MVSGTCVWCRWIVPLDDTWLTLIYPSGWCICLHCMWRQEGVRVRVDPWLREEIEMALGGA